MFFCKQKTADEMRISDWSSDVCSSDLGYLLGPKLIELGFQAREELPLVSLAGPYLDELSALTGDTVHLAIREDRKSVVEGTSVSVRVDLGVRRIIKKTKTYITSIPKSTLEDAQETQRSLKYTKP